MNSKEKVFSAIRGSGKEVPAFFWLNGKIKKSIADYLHIGVPFVDETLGNDIFQDWLAINKQMSKECSENETFTDEFGIVWKRNGEYNATIFHPLNNLTAAQIKQFALPVVENGERYTKTETLLNTMSDKFIGADVSGTIFEPAYHLRGLENLLMDLATEDESAQILLDKLTEFSTLIALGAIKRGVDWIWLGDDFGTQQNMIVSPNTWRENFKPRMKKIIRTLREARPDLIIAYHSCGSISQIIDDICEIGIDVLNPIQESASGMNQEKIRSEHPNLTLFCGLDTQQYLQYASSEDVYKQSLIKLEKLSKNGRYIFGCSHTIQHDVPVQNVLALSKALKDFNK